MQRAYAILSSVVCPAPQYFSTLSHERKDFRKKIIGHYECVLISSTNFSDLFLILRRNERDMTKMYIDLHVRYPLLLSDCNET
jgi:hypothetical protein